MSSHTCHNTGGLCGRPSKREMPLVRRRAKESVKLSTYENTSTTLSCGTFSAKTLDLAVGVDLVILKNRHLDLLTLVLDLFGSLETVTVHLSAVKKKQRQKHTL
jgi:hypothetical protein